VVFAVFTSSTWHPGGDRPALPLTDRHARPPGLAVRALAATRACGMGTGGHRRAAAEVPGKGACSQRER
jgi:hypothetical protein